MSINKKEKEMLYIYIKQSYFKKEKMILRKKKKCYITIVFQEREY